MSHESLKAALAISRCFMNQDSLTQSERKTCHLPAYNFAHDHCTVKINASC